MLAGSIDTRYYKYPPLLLALYITFLITSMCLANRLVSIGVLLEPGSIFIFPFTFLINDISSEVYGYSMSRRFIFIGLFCELVFSLSTTMVSHLPYPSGWNKAIAYTTVFDPTLLCIVAATFSRFIGEFVNAYLIVKWKIKLKGKLFWLRSIGASAIGQALFSIIFDIMNFSTKIPIKSLMWIMTCGFLWKMSYVILLVFPSWLVVKYIKKNDNVDVYDYGAKFNPFKTN